ncbi:MAG TPA: hypothetical protein DEB06_03755 [Phycisphaerales bacterium]|nr:hypothetical protein [Phycisphaerales bacterium]
MSLKHRAAAALIASVGVFAHAGHALAADDGTPYRVLKGERRPLRLDPEGKVLVLLGSARDGEVERSGLRDHLAAEGTEAFSMGEGVWAISKADGLAARDEGIGAFRAPVLIGETGLWLAPTPDMFVKFVDGVKEASIQSTLATIPGAMKITRDYYGIKGLIHVETSMTFGLDVLDVTNSLAESEGVQFAEPDWLSEARSAQLCSAGGGWVSNPPNDPSYASDWALNNVGQVVNCGSVGEFGDCITTPVTGVADVDLDAPQAWNITIGDPDVLVLVMDDAAESGPNVPFNHVAGWDFTVSPPVQVASTMGLCPSTLHACAVAKCVTGLINDSTESVGIAPGCRVILGKVRVGEAITWSSNTIRALGWAMSVGVRVTNHSSAFETTEAVEEAYEAAAAAGMIHFAGAGNFGEVESGSGIVAPARLPHVLAVGAIRADGDRACWSQYLGGVTSGPEAVDFAAPGECVALGTGTSFSSPYTAGVAALVLSRNPSLTAAAVEEILRNTADHTVGPVVGIDDETGEGLPKACAALTYSTTELMTDAAPGRFARIGPPATVVQNRPTFCWEAAPDLDLASGTVTYVVEITMDPVEQSPVFYHTSAELTTTSYLLPNNLLVNGQSYYWRVKASDGSTGPFRYSNRDDPYLSTWRRFTVNIVPGDADHNGVVDFEDFIAINVRWLTHGPRGDADGNGIVDSDDHSSVLANWLDTGASSSNWEYACN